MEEITGETPAERLTDSDDDEESDSVALPLLHALDRRFVESRAKVAA